MATTGQFFSQVRHDVHSSGRSRTGRDVAALRTARPSHGGIPEATEIGPNVHLALPTGDAAKKCLECHDDAEMKTDDGKSLAVLAVDFARSAHARKPYSPSLEFSTRSLSDFTLSEEFTTSTAVTKNMLAIADCPG